MESLFHTQVSCRLERVIYFSLARKSLDVVAALTVSALAVKATICGLPAFSLAEILLMAVCPSMTGICGVAVVSMTELGMVATSAYLQVHEDQVVFGRLGDLHSFETVGSGVDVAVAKLFEDLQWAANIRYHIVPCGENVKLALRPTARLMGLSSTNRMSSG